MLKFLDVTLRDGLYVAEYLDNKKTAYSIIKALLQAGIEFIEIGYWNDHVKEPGPSSCGREYLENLPKAKATYCMMIQSKNASRINFKELALTPVSLLRFPCLPISIKEIESYVYQAKEAGFKVSINIIRSSEHSLKEIISAAKIAESWNADWICVADSNGALLPERVYKIIYELHENIGAQLGFHAHNGLSFALSNALQAIKAGASLIDTSICGIGKGSNLSLELIGMFLGMNGMLDIKLFPIFETIYQNIYLNEGQHVLTKFEDTCTAVLNYNLDKILQLKSQYNLNSKEFLTKLIEIYEERAQNSLSLMVKERSL
ncbi:MAG: hypothetical protein JSS34_04405 [Proteobacteria bacterium]|nr:hypothetical protein [Pseudomonadota bacterium]